MPEPSFLKVTSLTAEQVEFAIQQVCRWMNTCEDNDRGSSSADASHSALLRRLLSGGTLLDEPPPKRFSYPAWELLEKDEVQIHEISTSSFRQILHKNKILYEGPVVTVDQSPEYVWEEEGKILRHVRLGVCWEYFEKECYPAFLKKGLDPEKHKYQGKFLRRIK